MDYSVRSGPLDELLATLRQFAADRAERGETERSTDAIRAAEILENGGEAAYFERVIWVVGEADRYSVISGERGDVLGELKQSAIGWDHQHKPGLAAQAVDGYERVSQGADLARVGHLLYVVRA